MSDGDGAFHVRIDTPRTASAAVSPSSSYASRGTTPTAAAIATAAEGVLRSQLRLEQRRSSDLVRQLEELRARLSDDVSSSSSSSVSSSSSLVSPADALRALELQLRNEQKRRAAAEATLKVAQAEAFKFKKALSDTRGDAQQRVNESERRYGDTTRRCNELEAANARLRLQVRELEAETQEQFEVHAAQRREDQGALHDARAAAALLQSEQTDMRRQLAEAAQTSKAAVSKAEAGKQQLKAALGKARLEAQQAKAETAAAAAKVKELTLAKSALQKQVKFLRRGGGPAGAELDKLIAEVTGGYKDGGAGGGGGGGDDDGEGGGGGGAGGAGGGCDGEDDNSSSTNNNHTGAAASGAPQGHLAKAVADASTIARLTAEVTAAEETQGKLVVLAQREQEIARRLREDLKTAEDGLAAKTVAADELQKQLLEERDASDRLRGDFKRRIALLDAEVGLVGG
jgi:chromosome segregation ATPase